MHKKYKKRKTFCFVFRKNFFLEHKLEYNIKKKVKELQD